MNSNNLIERNAHENRLFWEAIAINKAQTFHCKRWYLLKMAADLVHIIPVFYQIHWLLPTKYRHGMAPDFICKVISQRTSTRYSLRSSLKDMLEVPSGKMLSTLGRYSILFCGHEALEQSAERYIYIYIYIYISLFYGYLKLPQATQKGKRSKEGFEVTPQRYFGILQYARRHNHSFSLKQVSHAVFGSLFKAKHKQDPHLTKSCSTWGSVHYLRERKLVNRKTYSSNPFAPPLIKKKQTSKPVMPPS